MNRFEKTILIKCPIEQLYEFHLDINNLEKITPKDIKVQLLDKNVNIVENSIFRIKTTKFIFSTIWEIKIEKLSKPNILVDIALKSPFKSWRHSHIITKKGNMCELKDVVEYELPIKFLDKLLSKFVNKELEKSFSYRHKVTKDLLNNLNSK